MQIKHKLKDFEMKAAQMLFYFISMALPGELGKGFFNGFPDRVEFSPVCHSCASRNLYHSR